ncbi:MAG: SiaC family regulatory phosphoprotein [Sneathiellaceae bacterium]
MAGLDPLTLDGTRSSPRVEGDPQAGVLRLSGDSYPENTFEFYAPLLRWLSALVEHGDGPLRLEIGLSYLNTGSIKSMMDMLDLLEEAHVAGRPVAVVWRCDPEDERAVELAGELLEDLTLPWEIARCGAA